MKWLFLVNDAPFLIEFLGKVSQTFLKQGDSCTLVFTSKVAEYEKGKFFPENARRIAKPDWCLAHFDSKRTEHPGLTWRELFPNFNRRSSWPWGHKESARRLTQDYQFFEALFQNERPDAILFETPGGSAAQVAFLLCRRFGIPYLAITESRIAGRFEVWDSEYTNTQYAKTYAGLRENNISRGEERFAKRFIADFLNHKLRPSSGKRKVRFTLFGYLSHYAHRTSEVADSLLRYVKNRGKFRDVDFESEIRIHNAVRSPWKTALFQLRIALQKGLYKRADWSDEFYLFPLHVQPEASTTVRAMHYVDQAAAIHNIAFSLPFPAKLYVKENYSALGTKPASFYKKLLNIPNVVLIASQESMPELIARSKGVITLAGTAGMEATLHGKPPYLLGKAFYEYHPLCRTPKNFDELRDYILRDRQQEGPPPDLEEKNIRFVVSYMRHTIPGSVVGAVENPDPNNYGQIARELRKIAQERKGKPRVV